MESYRGIEGKSINLKSTYTVCEGDSLAGVGASAQWAGKLAICLEMKLLADVICALSIYPATTSCPSGMLHASTAPLGQE